MQGDEAETGSWWPHHRKKIVAREVPRSAEHVSDAQATARVEQEMLSAAAVSPYEAVGTLPDGTPGAAPRVHVVVMPVGTLSAKITRPPEAVLDPTLMGERHRKHGYKFAYLITQFATLLALLAATTSIVCQLIDESLTARLNAIAAVLLSICSLRLVRLTKLSSRLRGYAVAATALAGIALALTLAAVFFQNDSTPSNRSTTPASTSTGAPSGFPAQPPAPPGARQF